MIRFKIFKKMLRLVCVAAIVLATGSTYSLHGHEQTDEQRTAPLIQRDESKGGEQPNIVLDETWKDEPTLYKDTLGLGVMAVDLGQPVAIKTLFPDEVLASVIANTLKKNGTAELVSQTELNNIRSIVHNENVSGKAKIQNIEGLQYVNNLTTLFLEFQAIRDLTPLSGLTKLTRLHLKENNITDIEPLQKLTNIVTLNLDKNYISDITPLVKMRRLATLYLGQGDYKRTDLNPIEDYGTLSALMSLRDLKMHGKAITDIPEQVLRKVNVLELANSNITDISPLLGYKQLTHLHLGGNNVSDVSALAEQGLQQLLYLNLGFNKIRDISGLFSGMLPQLQQLDLRYNAISDVSPLAMKEFSRLIELNLSVNHILDLRPFQKTNLPLLQKLMLEGQVSEVEVMPSSTGLIIVENNVQDADGNLIAPHRFIPEGTGEYDEPEVIWNLPRPTKRTRINYKWSEKVEVADLMVQYSGTRLFEVVPAYTVTFIVDGSEYDVIDVPVGERITAPDKPVKLDLNFNGWYTEEAGGKKWNFEKEMMPNRNLTLYAQYVKDGGAEDSAPIIELFPDQGLAGVIATTLHKDSVEALVSQSELDTIIDIAYAGSGRLQIQHLDGIELLTNLRNLSLRYNQIADIHALSKLKQLQILDLKSNKVVDAGPVLKLSVLQELRLDSNEITDLKAFAKASLPALTVLDLSSNHITNLTPLQTAKWASLRQVDLRTQRNKPMQTVNYEPQISVPNAVTNIDGTLIAPNNYAPTGTGRYEAGTIIWQIPAPTGQVAVNYDWQTQVQINNIVAQYSGKYIVLVVGTYPLTLMNGDEVYRIIHAHPGQLVDEPDEPIKMGYKFMGWYTQQTGGSPWNFSTNKMPNEPKTLYARFAANRHAVTFVYGYDNKVETIEVSVEKKIKNPGGNTRPGFTLKGWFTAPRLGKRWNFTKDLMPNHDLTLYAQYSQNIGMMSLGQDVIVALPDGRRRSAEVMKQA